MEANRVRRRHAEQADARRHRDLTEIGLAAADCLARAVARGVYEAARCPFPAPCRPGRTGSDQQASPDDEPRQLIATVAITALLAMLLAGDSTASTSSMPVWRTAAPGTAVPAAQPFAAAHAPARAGPLLTLSRNLRSP